MVAVQLRVQLRGLVGPATLLHKVSGGVKILKALERKKRNVKDGLM